MAISRLPCAAFGFPACLLLQGRQLLPGKHLLVGRRHAKVSKAVGDGWRGGVRVCREAGAGIDVDNEQDEVLHGYGGVVQWSFASDLASSSLSANPRVQEAIVKITGKLMCLFA